MKIFVTGSSGFIGAELVKHLSGKHSIIEYDIKNGDDILDFERLKQKMAGSDVVVHTAAIKGPFADKTWPEYFQTNCVGTYNVAEAAFQNNVKRLVFTSSTTYYGMELGIPLPSNITETTPIITQRTKAEELSCRDCDVFYSTSKVIAEQTLANYGMTKKMQVVILRFGPTRKRGEHNPFGPFKLQLKIENGVQALQRAIKAGNLPWYEAFTILDENEHVDLSKAKKMLGYNPV